MPSPTAQRLSSETRPSLEPLRTVVWVDADPARARDVAKAFEAQRINTLLASSATEALALLKRETVHVLVADYWMKGADGIQLLAAAKRIRPRTLRVLLTDFEDYDLALRAINVAGVARLVPRQWGWARIQGVIAEVLEESSPDQRPPKATAMLPPSALLGRN